MSSITNYFLRFFLFFITLFLIFKIYFAYTIANGYPFGDWLINYQDGGFKRRGLLGTIAFFMYENFHIKVQYTVFFFQFLFHFLFFYYLVRLINLKKYNILDFVFLFTPFCLWGFVSDSGMGARKDGVLWFMLSFFTYTLTKDNISKWRWYFLYLIFFVSVFVHESFVFFFPCFITLYYFHTKKIELSKIILISLSFCIPTLIIFFGGMKNVGSEYTLDIIKASGINLQNDNIFTWKENEFIKLDYYYKHLYDYSLYSITFILQFVYVIFYLYIKEFKKEEIRKLVLLFFVCLLCTIPLFLIAIDIGRWFYNLFIFWSVLIISLLPSADSKTLVFDYKAIYSKKNISFIVLIFLSNFIYRAPSCFTGIEIAAPLRRLMLWLGYS
ncbi:hypothetical protein SAMN05421542_4685 [Chryseobacterium jejuense]|uniref:EpsG family protein n=1 Tax=Chryseobacterium jejuense TaxID=445960 RepID=A0A2X2WPE0_CHRJE|nr:hypothetical protein SAMN05421542_4685 [Chryseobacterium jejuense]SQB42718.1 Uncharacterised protein [Chryseobacterium jejuense]